MTDETLNLAQETIKNHSIISRCRCKQCILSRAYIDIHERLRKIAREAIAASQSIERGEVPLQKLCLILALTKGAG